MHVCVYVILECSRSECPVFRISLARFAAAHLLYSSFFGLGTLIVVTSHRTDTFGLPTLTSRILSADSALQKNNHLEHATAKEEFKLLFQPFNISFFHLGFMRGYTGSFIAVQKGVDCMIWLTIRIWLLPCSRGRTKPTKASQVLSTSIQNARVGAAGVGIGEVPLPEH